MTAEPADDMLPLPHGTDVVTRVDRSVEGEEVSAGTVGRIVGTHGEELDLQILGVGVVRYLRREVAPFRSAQLRYAVARDAAWTALHRNVVLEAIVGSQAWGLSDQHSDTDRRGLFVLPFPWTTRLGDVPADLLSADGSSTYWEVAKVVSNALRADPNTLELLFVPSVLAVDEMGEWILAERSAFLSSRIHASFGQYALSQLKKLKRSLHLAEHRDIILDWLRVDPLLSLDAAAVRLVDRARIIAPSIDAATLRAKEYLKQLYGSLFDQGLLSAKSFEALAAYAREEPGPSDLPRKLRPKNAYNLLRLLITATGWLRTGSPEFEMTGVVRSELLAIKNGEVALEDVLARADDLSRDLDDAHRNTRLPERPDVSRAQSLLLRVREEAARRWLSDADDPFGRLAAPVPLPEWKA
jgi:hypothetical protein